jgi:hypothetical protein
LVARVAAQRLAGGRGQERDPVLAALAIADGGLVAFEIDVLHPQAHRFQQTQAGPVEQTRHQADGAVQFGQQGADLASAQHRRHAHGPLGAHQLVQPRQFAAHNDPVQEQQGAQGLVLGGGADPTVGGQVRQERCHLRFTHLLRVALAVIQHEAADPAGAGPSRAAAVVSRADGIVDLVEQTAGRVGGRWCGHGRGGCNCGASPPADSRSAGYTLSWNIAILWWRLGARQRGPQMESVDFEKVIDVCRAHGTRKITLFGSFVRGEADPDSDVDLIVAFSGPTGLLALVRLERELSEVLGRGVDLLTEESISPYLRERIQREQRVIYEAAG